MSVQDQPQKIISLTNSTGVALTEDSDMPGTYTITLAGAGNADFYLSWNGSLNIEAILDQFFVDAAVTVAHTLELYVNGGWLSVAAWESGSLDATAAQKINASYPLRDMIPSGTKARVRLAVGGACDAFCRVIGI
jgi:hypothetical protein